MDHTNANNQAYFHNNMSSPVAGTPGSLCTDATGTISSPSTATASAVPVVDEELRCRYSNKRCMNPRTAKRTGGLHTFCEEHRESANRNQRRLDQKKRVEKRQQESIQTYYETLQAVGELPNTLPIRTHMAALPPPTTEPFAQPAPLLEEDLDVLASLFGLEDHEDHTS